MRCFFGFHCWHEEEDFEPFEKVKTFRHGSFGKDVKETFFYYKEYICCHCGKEFYEVANLSASYSSSD